MSEYSAVPSTGKLKLKGVKDSRIDKKKKKKKPPPTITKNDPQPQEEEQEQETDFNDKSVVLKKLQDEDEALTKESRREVGVVDGEEVTPGAGVDDPDLKTHLKTEAEKRYDEQRRKRLEDRLKREGVKTHKERVEDLNRYLSTLSEHHDMPKIGPG